MDEQTAIDNIRTALETIEQSLAFLKQSGTEYFTEWVMEFDQDAHPVNDQVKARKTTLEIERVTDINAMVMNISKVVDL